jgi:hypothetical protein
MDYTQLRGQPTTIPASNTFRMMRVLVMMVYFNSSVEALTLFGQRLCPARVTQERGDTAGEL